MLDVRVAQCHPGALRARPLYMGPGTDGGLREAFSTLPLWTASSPGKSPRDGLRSPGAARQGPRCAWISGWCQLHTQDSCLEGIFWFPSSASPFFLFTQSQPRNEPFLCEPNHPLAPLRSCKCGLYPVYTLLLGSCVWPLREQFQGGSADCLRPTWFHF